MRSYSEPTARNLLRRPLIFGVPLYGLAALAATVLAVSIACGTSVYGNLIASVVGALGYIALRIFNSFAKSGWEESLLFALEKFGNNGITDGTLTLVPAGIDVSSPDTFDELALMAHKEALLESVNRIRPGERMTFACSVDQRGAALHSVTVNGRFSAKQRSDVVAVTGGLVSHSDHVYSMHQLPVTTDPLWLFSILSRIPGNFRAFVSLRGIDHRQIRRRIESSRRNNARTTSMLSDIDAEVTFEEASTVLTGLSRGDEAVTELSLVIASEKNLDLDDSLFCLEKDSRLAVYSVLGIRSRFHRSHFVRAVTATDLIPNVLDAVDTGAAIMTTLRGKPLYFSPNDPRLEALHWLVVGASGSGKSFFTGLVLRRMIEAGTPMSVIFIDHNRSFRRLVRAHGQAYLEPKALPDFNDVTIAIFDHLEQPGTMIGVELSDLGIDEKKPAAHLVLAKIETFLRFRESTHPVYVVLDECWNFMRDEPMLVQRAFREFRKLNGAAVAITQSLSDFLTDQSGQSIFQNAPVRILLRQGEDLARYQGILGLNSVELSKVRALKQQKGVFSECLIKTPFLSRFGRLYPTDIEHSLLRTDNLREDLAAETRALRLAQMGRDQCELQR